MQSTQADLPRKASTTRHETAHLQSRRGVAYNCYTGKPCLRPIGYTLTAAYEFFSSRPPRRNSHRTSWPKHSLLKGIVTVRTFLPFVESAISNYLVVGSRGQLQTYSKVLGIFAIVSMIFCTIEFTDIGKDAVLKACGYIHDAMPIVSLPMNLIAWKYRPPLCQTIYPLFLETMYMLLFVFLCGSIATILFRVMRGEKPIRPIVFILKNEFHLVLSSIVGCLILTACVVSFPHLMLFSYGFHVYLYASTAFGAAFVVINAISIIVLNTLICLWMSLRAGGS